MPVTVKLYETKTALRSNKAIGVFTIELEPEQFPVVSEALKGKTTTSGKDLYELAVERRATQVERAITACKENAINKVRDIVGPLGILVATIEAPEEPKEETKGEKP